MRPGKNGGLLKTGGTKGGRPPKLVNAMLRDLKAAGYERVGATTVTEIFETMLNLPKQEMKRIANDEGAPMSARIAAKSLLSAKGWDVLQTMLDRAHGKAKQQVDMAASVSGSVPTITVQVLPPSQNVGG